MLSLCLNLLSPILCFAIEETHPTTIEQTQDRAAQLEALAVQTYGRYLNKLYTEEINELPQANAIKEVLIPLTQQLRILKEQIGIDLLQRTVHWDPTVLGYKIFSTQNYKLFGILMNISFILETRGYTHTVFLESCEWIKRYNKRHKAKSLKESAEVLKINFEQLAPEIIDHIMKRFEENHLDFKFDDENRNQSPAADHEMNLSNTLQLLSEQIKKLQALMQLSNIQSPISLNLTSLKKANLFPQQ